MDTLDIIDCVSDSDNESDQEPEEITGIPQQRDTAPDSTPAVSEPLPPVDVEDAVDAINELPRTIRVAFDSPEAPPDTYIWYVNYLTPHTDYRWALDNCVVTAVVLLGHADTVVIVGEETPASADIPPHRKLFLQLDPQLPPPDGVRCVTLQQRHRVAIPWSFLPFQKQLEKDMPIKTKSVCMIFSKKDATPLQRKRGELVHALEKAGLQVDVYGRMHPPDAFPHYFGKQDARDKSRILDSYRYCIAIEKYATSNFVTNHFIDPMLSYTLPIYYGAPNIAELYPDDSYVAIDSLDSMDAAVNHICRVVRQPVNVAQVAAMSHARRLILTKYSLWATLRDVVGSQSAASAPS